ncbi:MAG: 30S ribosomal protein S18 [Candidatus Cloacimonetes bacterium]|nr:30S ribosomal protein S18 [Candidatus Cloacimonadota bacterium]
MIENETNNDTVVTAAKSEVQDPDRRKRPEDSSNGHSPRKPFRGNPKRSDKRKFFMKKKVCFFCKNKEAVIDYKDANMMRRFIAESGKITPRRFSGTCAKHQRKLSTEIKKARQMALIPYTDK